MTNSRNRKPRRLFYRGFADHDHIDVDMGDDPIGSLVSRSFDSGQCPNCSLVFTRYTTERPRLRPEERNSSKSVFAQIQILLICRHCGWWQLKSEATIYKKGKVIHEGVRSAHEYHSLLEEIDISSNDVLLADLKAHLVQRWDDRRFISAFKAEQLVADILKDHVGGDVYHATANINEPDGGIDLFVCTSDGQIRAAVQVKRRESRKVEPVQEVRNFVGALIVEGYDKGIFVTTASRFSAPAEATVRSPHFARHRLELELIDGEKLLELLRATTSTGALRLPPDINNNTIWYSSEGVTLDTFALLSLGPATLS